MYFSCQNHDSYPDDFPFLILDDLLDVQTKKEKSLLEKLAILF